MAGLGFSAEVSFFPEANRGFAVLSNLGMAVQFTLAVRQRLLELVFGAENPTEPMLQAAAKKSAFLEKMYSGLMSEPAAMPWMQPLLGLYRNEELGTARLAQKQERYWIEFEDWSSVLASEVRPGGARFMVLTTPLWTQLQIEVEANGDLVLQAGQGWQEKLAGEICFSAPNRVVLAVGLEG
jgi:hypothetical protein